ncbi:hypothetical protein BDY17DRAFT_251121 [Neohortaea acidophila]|uniref:Nucleotide-diphospho-sugar transferase n=1 Tax=Neohortaea acidophila TaxID=245834 RepID=A0A6A6PTT5_9PEZI|nr:uncharacterized protein BDY17DRAFT_251121 [Neohortaea acidophila]KAF2483101.1 hypothetical protein BDY17DRAFT_251121 [Neohortaea acidophila]
MNATEVKLHTYTLNTHNVWWKQLENHVTLVPHDRFALHGPKNINISSFLLPHQSDFLRLDILRLEGGVYLDMDMFPLKPFSDLLSNPRDAVLGHEGGNRYGLGNAVILTRPSSAFLLKWWATYASFNDRIWNDHSVLIPKRIAISHPDLVCTLSPTVFYWPTWAKTHTHYMHDPISANEVVELKGNMSRYGGAMYENQLGWHGSGGGLDYLSKLTPEALLTTDTRFNILLREVYAAEL